MLTIVDTLFLHTVPVLEVSILEGGGGLKLK